MFGSVKRVVQAHRGAAGFAAGVLVCAAVGGGVAIAAVPATNTGLFTACVNNSSGAVRLVDYQAGRRCTASEHIVTWSKGYRYRSTWSASASYAVFDVVVSDGSAYVAKAPSQNRPPATSAAVWGLLAAKGAQGPQGVQGPQGPAGLVGRTVVTNVVNVPAAPARVLADVTCPSGTVPIGGGAHYGNFFGGNGDARYAYVAESDIDDNGTGWASTLVTAGSQGASQFIATAICVNG